MIDSNTIWPIWSHNLLKVYPNYIWGIANYRIPPHLLEFLFSQNHTSYCKGLKKQTSQVISHRMKNWMHPTNYFTKSVFQPMWFHSHFPYHPWDWYIFTHMWLIFLVHVGKYRYTIHTWILWDLVVYFFSRGGPVVTRESHRLGWLRNERGFVTKDHLQRASVTRWMMMMMMMMMKVKGIPCWWFITRATPLWFHRW